MRILHIEDDSGVAQMVSMVLRGAGAFTESTDLGEEGVELARLYEFDAIICDGHLPDMAGLDVVRSVRAAKIATPILMLTSETVMAHRLAAFRAGVDDYVAKPCDREELVARLRALVRRSKGHAQPEVTVGAISLDLDARVARVHGAQVHLTGKEFQLLELLVLRKGATVTKDAILTNLYGGRDEPEIKIVDVFVCKLRRKIGAALRPGDHMPIETVWGRGYSAVDAPRARPEPEAAGRSRLGPLCQRVLETLEARPRSFGELYGEIGGEVTSLRSSVSKLMIAGRVANVGASTRGAAVYQARGVGA